MMEGKTLVRFDHDFIFLVNLLEAAQRKSR
jgi:hypothetical protein